MVRSRLERGDHAFALDVIDRPVVAVSVLCARAAIAMGVLFLVLIALPDSHLDWWLAVGAGIGAILTGLLLLINPGLLSLPVLDALLVATDGLLVLVCHFVPAVQPAFPGVYLVIGCILFALRSWPVILGHLTLVGASYAGVLYVGPTVFAPASRWCTAMIIIGTLGMFVRWLVGTVIGLAMDERKARAGAELAAEALSAESDAKNVFLARMSHELRTPLNVVVGFSDLLAENLSGPLNDRQREYIGDIGDSARHLVTLVDEVLDLANVASGDLRISVAPVDLRDVVFDAVAMLRDEARAKTLDLDTLIAYNLPEVEADRVRIRQVLVNLLANAVRFTPDGGRIQIRAWADAERPGTVCVAVDDTGVGVAPHDRQRIFEEFAQGSDTSEGAGLGLPLARRIIELHGGTLTLQPRAGGGSSFGFDLPPRPPAENPDTDAEDRAADADYSAFTEPGSPSNRRLLTKLSLQLVMVGSVIEIMIGLIAPWPWQERVITAGAGVVQGLALRYGPKPPTLSPRMIDWFAYLYIGIISLVAFYVRSFTDLIPLGYAWVTMLTFALWPVRRAMLQLAAIGASYALVLSVRHVPMPAAHWVSIMVLLSFNAEIVAWTTSRLRLLVVAEQDAHRAARRVNAELTATSRHKSMFVANMSHELRTPLSAIIGFSGLLESGMAGELPERQREYVQDVHESAKQLLAIINDVLDVARIEAGQLNLNLDVISVRAMLESAIALGCPPPTHLARISLTVEPGAEYVIADPDRLGQVLTQLVSNAGKFTQPGGHVEVSARPAPGNEVHLAVTDSGIGILPEQIPRIFDAFHQGTRLPFDQFLVGTGLGLALAKSIVEMHSGRISVTSVPDQGSTFVVAVPGMGTSAPSVAPAAGGTA